MAWKGGFKPTQPGGAAPRYKGSPAPLAALPAPKGGGKAAGKGGFQAAKGGFAKAAPVDNLSTVQMEFEDWAQHLADLITDLNQPAIELQKVWARVSTLRARLIELHEVSMRPGAAQDGSGLDNPKGLLVSAYSKLKKTNMTKDDIAYTVEALPEGGFVATVSGALFQGGHYTGEPAASKKAAEHAAAYAAIMEEFPEAAGPPKAPAMAIARGKGKQLAAAAPRGAPAQSQGEKRKRGQDNEKTFKARLHEMVQTLNGGQSNKEDVVYETSPVDGENGSAQPSAWVSRVSLPNYNPDLVYEGAPQMSKKDAENSAAESAVADLEEQVRPLEEERKAKKRKQMQEKEAQRRAMKAAEEGEAAPTA